MCHVTNNQGCSRGYMQVYAVYLPAVISVGYVIIIIIMQRLTRHVSFIRMTNHRCGGHVDLRVAVSVIKRFEFLFESVCSDVQVASDDVR